MQQAGKGERACVQHYTEYHWGRSDGANIPVIYAFFNVTFETCM